MRRLNAKDILAIIDFIYHGEVNIYQEDLDCFLGLADELQLKGLAGSGDRNIVAPETKIRTQNTHKSQRNNVMEYNNINQSKTVFDNKPLLSENFESSYLVTSNTENLFVATDTTQQDVQGKMDSMILRVDDGAHAWKCNVCGKATNNRSHIRDHVETHIQGVSYPCTQCGKVSRSGHALRVHISAYHKK